MVKEIEILYSDDIIDVNGVEVTIVNEERFGKADEDATTFCFSEAFVMLEFPEISVDKLLPVTVDWPVNTSVFDKKCFDDIEELMV